MITDLFKCYFCEKEMNYFAGMLMPVTYITGERSKVFTCFACLRKHDETMDQ